MPWSPLLYTKQIFENLKRKGFENEVHLMELRRAIMQETKLVKSESISNTIRAFEELGYISRTGDNIFKINWDAIEVA